LEQTEALSCSSARGQSGSFDRGHLVISEWLPFRVFEVLWKFQVESVILRPPAPRDEKLPKLSIPYDVFSCRLGSNFPGIPPVAESVERIEIDLVNTAQSLFDREVGQPLRHGSMFRDTWVEKIGT
jgi:hypothetical protein